MTLKSAYLLPTVRSLHVNHNSKILMLAFVVHGVITSGPDGCGRACMVIYYTESYNVMHLGPRMVTLTWDLPRHKP